MTRTVLQQFPAQRDDIGDLITRRPLPGPGIEQLDPFLFLNHHGPQTYPPNNQGLPFGPHPHRGFETVTFILKGELSHLDSGGHESIIGAGGVQWMTAGSGLVHAELSPQSFKREGGPLEILQLWVNLPGRLKMTPPAYVGLQRADTATITEPLAEVRLISGEYVSDGHGARRGPIESLTGLCLMTVHLQAGARLSLPAPWGENVFLYVVDGEAEIAGTPLQSHHLVELDETHDRVTVEATGPATLLYGHGAPLGEPVASYGPFVMNTREEIQQAFADYQAGKFGHIAS
ncbi:pirin family protein [Pseudomonas sp. CFBP 8771]|uniref:pirin family protein n=1 Tax=Pseudomonas sp. CFBP 8771 TaxID=2775285 RepID=UPI0017865112|nr:pirin family protein [Pseudomonas sp. CFBP 8771]MBD8602818.1 pirin family protein [Pseudomonas sp. CFBP 8771]